MIEKLIMGFVEKSGGLEKIIKARNGFRSVPDKDRAEFIRRCAKTDEGARQIMAAALLGFAIAAEVGRSVVNHLEQLEPEDQN